jgi:hypothetical protein
VCVGRDKKSTISGRFPGDEWTGDCCAAVTSLGQLHGATVFTAASAGARYVRDDPRPFDGQPDRADHFDAGQDVRHVVGSPGKPFLWHIRYAQCDHRALTRYLQAGYRGPGKRLSVVYTYVYKDFMALSRQGYKLLTSVGMTTSFSRDGARIVVGVCTSAVDTTCCHGVASFDDEQ